MSFLYGESKKMYCLDLLEGGPQATLNIQKALNLIKDAYF